MWRKLAELATGSERSPRRSRAPEDFRRVRPARCRHRGLRRSVQIEKVEYDGHEPFRVPIRQRLGLVGINRLPAAIRIEYVGDESHPASLVRVSAAPIDHGHVHRFGGQAAGMRSAFAGLVRVERVFDGAGEFLLEHLQAILTSEFCRAQARLLLEDLAAGDAIGSNAVALESVLEEMRERLAACLEDAT